MCAQDDIVHEDLTVRENLAYSAWLRSTVHMNREAKGEVVDDVIDLLRLRHVQVSRRQAASNQGMNADPSIYGCASLPVPCSSASGRWLVCCDLLPVCLKHGALKWKEQLFMVSTCLQEVVVQLMLVQDANGQRLVLDSRAVVAALARGFCREAWHQRRAAQARQYWAGACCQAQPDIHGCAPLATLCVQGAIASVDTCIGCQGNAQGRVFSSANTLRRILGDLVRPGRRAGNGI